MKKLLFFTIILSMILSAFVCPQVFAADDIEIFLFGEKVECDVAPVIEDGRTLVPVRVISEKGLGASVKWNGEKKEVTITKDKLTVVLTIGSTLAMVNGIRRTLDVPAKLMSDRTMVPVRFVAETFKYKVDWDNDNRRVLIENLPTDDEDKDDDINSAAKDDDEDDKEDDEALLIERISIRRSKSNVAVRVYMSRYSKPKIFTLQEPYRIVMDFEDYIFEDGDDSIDVDSEFVRQVRHAKNSGFYRIVVECIEECEYDYDKTSSGFSLIISPKDGEREDSDDDNDKDDDDKDSDDNDDKGDDDDKDIDDEDDEEEEEYKRISPEKPESVKDAIVVIDAGHGGKDPGALARDEEGEIMYDEDGEEYIKEKDINLAVAKKVHEYLEDKGINAVLTRSKDEYLELREISDIANEEEAHLFVSIHCNSVDGVSTAEGVEVLYFDKENDEAFGITSKAFADTVLSEITDRVDTIDRGLRERPGLAVLKWTDMPAALVELGFLTNANDQERLLNKAWRNNTAKAIAEGIINALETMVD